MGELNTEINNVLKSFFREEELFELNRHLFTKNYYKENDFENLNEIDKDQLSVSFSPATERILIDRAITYAKKRMNHEKFAYFLNEIAKVCIAYGKMKLAQEILSNAKKEIKKKDLKAEVYLTIADMYSRNAKWRKSFAAINNAKRIYDKDENLYGIAKCENLLGTIAGDRGEIKKALTHFQNGFNYAEEQNDTAMAATMETNLGIINNIIGNYSEAHRYFNLAIRKFVELKDKRRITEVSHNIALSFLSEELYDLSLEQLDKCINNAIESKYLSILGIAYLNKAQIYIRQDKLKEAAQFLDKALDICSQNNDKLSVADIYKLKGIVSRKHADFIGAKAYFLASIKLNNRLNNQLNLAETFYELAENYKNVSEFDKEKSFLKKSLFIFSKIGESEMIDKIENNLAINERQLSGLDDDE